jgi:branched-chain amino acid transport system ATP-binding protein
LLLDEPSLGLAPLLVKEIARIIQEIKDSGLSVILVEQNASLSLKLADKGCVLETGRVAIEGNAHELINNDYIKKAYLGG